LALVPTFFILISPFQTYYLLYIIRNYYNSLLNLALEKVFLVFLPSHS
jgi:hypothetical protein